MSVRGLTMTAAPTPARANSPSRCEYCGGAFGAGLGTKGFQYADGRLICESCHRSSVKTPAHLQSLWNRVFRWVNELGYAVDLRSVPVTLIDRRIFEQDYAAIDAEGLALTVEYFRPASRVLIRQESEVMLLYGVPEINAIHILAHEAGHIHCRQTREAYTSDEEGFCEFVAYQVLEGVGTAEAKVLRNQMTKNPDIHYGGVLRDFLGSRRQLQGEKRVHG